MRTGIAVVIALLLAATAWAALAPLQAGSRDLLFEIPKGTWDRRMKGDKSSILPEQLTLMLGVRDVLLLRNSDTVPQMFGPVLIMPGQDFRLPFAQAGEHPFDCTAHASGRMTVLVVDAPAAGLPRLMWRLHSLLNT
ncbi:hypothetical protein [Massilia sp. 9I]|uniref:hypothetical protein n=1 Tax=Massilia sp. 9I TaxID=2653152 RepID=UPI00135CB8FD|nr:hypothetical protein [Massilia sp. 9I]